MKIPPTPENVRFLPSGADRDPNGNFYDQETKDKKDREQRKKRAPSPYFSQPNEREELQVTHESVNAAMATFQADKQTRAQGIAAEVQGTGPGLRVVLKDGSGATIRSLSGEEFLRLREATNDVRVSGKIFDKKA